MIARRLRSTIWNGSGGRCSVRPKWRMPRSSAMPSTAFSVWNIRRGRHRRVAHCRAYMAGTRLCRDRHVQLQLSVAARRRRGLPDRSLPFVASGKDVSGAWSADRSRADEPASIGSAFARPERRSMTKLEFDHSATGTSLISRMKVRATISAAARSSSRRRRVSRSWKF